MSTTSDTNIFHDFAYQLRPLRFFAFGFKLPVCCLVTTRPFSLHLLQL